MAIWLDKVFVAARELDKALSKSDCALCGGQKGHHDSGWPCRALHDALNADPAEPVGPACAKTATRDLAAVIDALVAVAPELGEPLAAARTSACFAAPENMHLFWSEAQEVLQALVTPEHAKHKALLAIWAAEYELRPQSYGLGDLMTLEQFKRDVDNGCLIDDDGCGEWATLDQVSNLAVHPSDAAEDFGTFKAPDPIFTHVLWYNK